MSTSTTGIGWTNRTWNPTRGCLPISPGCKNCYAMKQANRFKGPGKPYEGLVKLGNNGPVWTGEAREVRAALREPLGWLAPSFVFVDSMSDLFFERFSDGFVMDVWRVMASCPQHTFQILTKRMDRMAAWLRRWADRKEEDLEPKMARGPEEIRKVHTCGRALLWAEMLEGWGPPPDGCAFPTYDWMDGPVRWPTALPNVWPGFSAEDQKHFDERWAAARGVPAAVLMVSLEPLLGPVVLPSDFLALGRRAWVIVGGEAHHGARPFDLAWARALIVQCRAAGVPIFVKQVGARPVWGDGDSPGLGGRGRITCVNEPASICPSPQACVVRGRCEDGICLRHPKGEDPAEWPEDLRVREWPRG